MLKKKEGLNNEQEYCKLASKWYFNLPIFTDDFMKRLGFGQFLTVCELVGISLTTLLAVTGA